MLMMASTVLAILLTTVLAQAPAAAPAKTDAKSTPAKATAMKPAGKTFDSPKAAADALLEATSTDDVSAMKAIFGPDGERIASSGDPTADKNDRVRFTELAKKKMEVVVDPKKPHRATVTIGEDNWPFPVPLVENGGKWQFASKDGLREILFRRVGRNELNVIQICQGYVEAQKEYALVQHDASGVNEYAQKILSSPGKQDGLAWYDSNGKPAGPIGDEVAKALEEGYKSKTEPFHGYFFKVLKSQGPAAPKGKLDYVIQGNMIGGFALVAWPAEYRASGVKTFIVSHDGIVYEKDLGPETAKVAAAMKAYNPDKTWKKSPEADQ
jgi:hypothetical protein